MKSINVYLSKEVKPDTLTLRQTEEVAMGSWLTSVIPSTRPTVATVRTCVKKVGAVSKHRLMQTDCLLSNPSFALTG